MPNASRSQAEQLRALLAASLHSLLAQLSSRHDLEGVAETAGLSDEYWEAFLSVAPKARLRLVTEQTQELKASDRQILAVATREVQKVQALARKVGRKAHSSFRKQVKELADAGYLIHQHGGYRLP